MKKALLTGIAALLLTTGAASAPIEPGQINLIDGDTIRVANETFRACKSAASRARRATQDDLAVSGLSAPRDTAKSNDAFDRLRGNAVLSDWKPHVTLETDIPDIPDFLQRKPTESPKACAQCGQKFQPTTFQQSRCADCNNAEAARPNPPQGRLGALPEPACQLEG